MGRKAKTTASPETAGDREENLRTEIDAWEKQRTQLLASGLDTVQAQIDHLTIMVSITSHLASLARIAGDLRSYTSLGAMLAKLNDDIRGLQKNAIDDKLNELLRRADDRDEARSILEKYK